MTVGMAVGMLLAGLGSVQVPNELACESTRTPANGMAVGMAVGMLLAGLGSVHALAEAARGIWLAHLPGQSSYHPENA